MKSSEHKVRDDYEDSGSNDKAIVWQYHGDTQHLRHVGRNVRQSTPLPALIQLVCNMTHDTIFESYRSQKSGLRVCKISS